MKVQYIQQILLVMIGAEISKVEASIPPKNQGKETEVKLEKLLDLTKLFKIKGDELKQLLHRSIGAVSCLNSEKELYYGSGVLISKNLVLTCAHNIFDRKTGTLNQQFKFYLENKGKAKNFYKVIDFRFPKAYRTSSSNKQAFPYEFALLKLQKQVQYDQFLRISVPCSACLMDKNKEIELKIFGYPIYEKNYVSLDSSGNTFLLSQYGLARKNRIKNIDDSQHKMMYSISTQRGQSGCPVVIGDQIIAIHIGNHDNCNIARIIDTSLVNNLEEWCYQLQAYPFRINDNNMCPHIFPKQDLQINLSKSNLSQFAASQELRTTKLNLNQNQLQSINLDKNIVLFELNLGRNKIKSIKLSNNINLRKLSLGNNHISSINLQDNKELIELNLDCNQLTSISVSNNKKLKYLYLCENKIYQIDVSQNIQLMELYLKSNKISKINLKKNIDLTLLSLCKNQITQIDLTQNKNLVKLYLNKNRLSTISLMNNINLQQLQLNDNDLKQISLILTPQLFQIIQDMGNESYKFMNQNSTVCKVNLAYSQHLFQKFKDQFFQWIQQEYRKEYRKQGDYNQYKCDYQFLPTKI